MVSCFFFCKLSGLLTWDISRGESYNSLPSLTVMYSDPSCLWYWCLQRTQSNKSLVSMKEFKWAFPVLLLNKDLHVLAFLPFLLISPLLYSCLPNMETPTEGKLLISTIFFNLWIKSYNWFFSVGPLGIRMADFRFCRRFIPLSI